MLRTYEFYEEEYFISRDEIDRISKIISDFEKGIVNEKDLYSLNLNSLKFCIAECKIDTLIKLISPVAYQDGPNVGYKYFMDAISLGLLDYINTLPSSIMERYANMLRSQQEESIMMGETPFEEELVTVREAAHNAVILTPVDKKKIIDALLTIDLNKISNIRIKDVFARQICGMGFPIRSEKDVAFYSEVSNYLPCLELFNMNIRTTSNDTSGCIDDLDKSDSKCEISIHYGSLDEANKCVADAIVESGNGHFIRSFVDDGQDLMITVPCDVNERVSEVNVRMMKLISKFHKQDILYGVVDLQDAIMTLKRWSAFLSGDERKRIQGMIKEDMTASEVIEVVNALELSYVCDSDGTIYSDMYCLNKHKEYIMENGMQEKKTIE